MMKNFGLHQTKGSNPVQGANFDLSRIRFSKNDLRRNVTIPTFLSKELAEDIGIHIGDGCLEVRNGYYIITSGHTSEDKIYYNHFVAELKFNLYNIIPSKSINNNETQLRLRSKAIADFYNKVLEIPIGKKSSIIKIPDIISNSPFCINCVKGIMDTDFSLSFKKKDKKHHKYPVISAALNSKELVVQLEQLFKRIGLKPHVEYDYKRYDKRTGRHYTQHFIYLNGEENLNKWWNIIKSDNAKHITKYLVWKKFGFCPPYTTVRQRINYLVGKTDISNFYN